MEHWQIYEAYGAWVAEESCSGKTVWALTLDELKRHFMMVD